MRPALGHLPDPTEALVVEAPGHLGWNEVAELDAQDRIRPTRGGHDEVARLEPGSHFAGSRLPVGVGGRAMRGDERGGGLDDGQQRDHGHSQRASAPGEEISHGADETTIRQGRSLTSRRRS
jgi:hypothetical protein